MSTIDDAKKAIMFAVCNYADSVACGNSVLASQEYNEINARLDALLELDRQQRTEDAARIVADYQAQARRRAEGGHA